MGPGSGVTSAGHSGTSMACPHVSGGAAPILDADPDEAPAKVLDELLTGSVKAAITGLKSGGDQCGVAFLELRGAEQDLEKSIHSVPSLGKNVEPDSIVSMIPEIEVEPEANT